MMTTDRNPKTARGRPPNWTNLALTIEGGFVTIPEIDRVFVQEPVSRGWINMHMIRPSFRQTARASGGAFGFFLAVAYMLLIAASSNPAEEGSEDVPTSCWDFGYLPQKAEVGHLFYLHNPGSVPVTVTKIKSGCSCTNISEVDAPIAPGDSAAIVVVFKSGRYLGRVQKTTKVFTDDPAAPVRHLRIKAVIVKRGEKAGCINAVPYQLKWKTENESIARAADTIMITSSADDTLSVAVLHFPTEQLDSVEHPGRIAPGEGINVVTHTSNQPLASESKALSMTLAFTGRDTTIITIPVEIEN